MIFVVHLRGRRERLGRPTISTRFLSAVDQDRCLPILIVYPTDVGEVVAADRWQAMVHAEAGWFLSGSNGQLILSGTAAGAAVAVDLATQIGRGTTCVDPSRLLGVALLRPSSPVRTSGLDCWVQARLYPELLAAAVNAVLVPQEVVA